MGWAGPGPSRAQSRIVYRPGSAYRWDTAAELTTPDRRAGRAWQVPAGTAVTPLPSPKSAQATASGIGVGDRTPADAVPRSPVNGTRGPALRTTGEGKGSRPAAGRRAGARAFCPGPPRPPPWPAARPPP